MADLGPFEDVKDPVDQIEERLRLAARGFIYPPTPKLSARISIRQLEMRHMTVLRFRLATIAALVVLALGMLFAVPGVRATVLDWIRIGAVRILLVKPTAAPSPTPLSGTPTPGETPTPQPSPTPLTSVLDISGETSLSQAQSQAGFNLLLPAYPPDLSRPDHIYFQDLGGPIVILVWMDKTHPGQVELVLSETTSENIIFTKILPQSVENSMVNGQPAVWVDAPYLLITGNGQTKMTRLIPSGHTLIWTVGKFTCRLETNDDLSMAIRIAQSIQ